ncbi:hypothetical protein L208DRAFT_1288230 [Tricholoma matsutake]|nr:hypothetical protein L208DRAFT_1288230 [Tricholoma matsutake 945]
MSSLTVRSWTTWRKNLVHSLNILSSLSHLFWSSAAAKKTWRSPVYSFFKADVTIEVHKGHITHFSPCSAKNSKTEAQGTRCYQDKRDKASTANLCHHAIRCFGQDAVNMAVDGKPGIPTSNIFSLFAHQGQWPVTYSHCAHLNPEFCNHPANIISDPELIDLLMTGHLHLKVPCPNTIRCDVKAAYMKCHECVSKLLQDHPGHIHFTTDVWTSTNHHMFVAWTVHLEHNGTMLAFLLDAIEVPESHTGVALVKAFQQILEVFGLQEHVSL